MPKRSLFASAVLAVALAGGACSVHETAAPSLTGPSDFSLSVGITAQPDSINQDGGSQSAIHVTARDATGKAVVGQIFRLDILVNGSQVDYGNLSARTLVSGGDGAAFAIYTAPAALPNGATVGTCHTLAGQCVVIAATPSGVNFAASQTQSVEIRLQPVGVIQAPVVSPTAQFTTSPATATANSPVIFDGSSSCAGPLVTTGSGSSATTTCNANGLTITNYQWTFGDGATGTGVSIAHTYSGAQTYSAALLVTNSVGGSASATKAVTIGASSAPTAAFTVSPSGTSPRNTQLNFNANSSAAAPGHSIVAYSWDFGDGTTDNTGPVVQHPYTYVGAGPTTYVVTLTVTDDIGSKKTATLSVTVS